MCETHGSAAPSWNGRRGCLWAGPCPPGWWLAAVLLLLAASRVSADTVFQTNSQGKEVILQREAIVTQQDSSFVVYKHFDLKERRVTVVRLNRGSLPLRVQTSDAAERARIVERWKQFGYKASVIDTAGKVLQVYDLFLDFYPPGGRGSLLESVPAVTSFSLMAEDGGADDIAFDKIDRVEIRGEQLTVVLREGKTVTGKYLMPTTQPAEVRLLGITDKYDPASPTVFDLSVPLIQLKTISF